MNPAKRKKLYRLSLAKKEVKVEQQEKVVQKEEVKEVLVVQAPIIQETATEVVSTELEHGLKVLDTVTEVPVEAPVQVENKKDKKKKYSSQDV